MDFRVEKLWVWESTSSSSSSSSTSSSSSSSSSGSSIVVVSSKHRSARLQSESCSLLTSASRPPHGVGKYPGPVSLRVSGFGFRVWG